MLCPKCKTDLEDGRIDCPVCGWELTEEEQRRWVVIGMVSDRPFADMARETLKSQGIPAVVMSRSGFFGNVGLPLIPVFDAGRAASFEVIVPRDYAEQARETMDMTLGEKWEPEEN